jgi:hypothetical protein
MKRARLIPFATLSALALCGTPSAAAEARGLPVRVQIYR